MNILTETTDRSRWIGGSDIAGILGISPWKTPLDVYLEKLKQEPIVLDEIRRKAMARGIRMEPYVLDILKEEEGLTIIARNQRYSHPQHSFLRAEIDAETDDGENVEIKTVSPFSAKSWGEPGTDEIPVHYTAQAIHGLMVTGRKVCIFGVLIGGDDFRVYRVERDEEAVDFICRAGLEFWKRIEDRTPPEPVNTADLSRLYPKHVESGIEADTETLKNYHRLVELRVGKTRIESDIEEAETAIKSYMGDRATLLIDQTPLATWKTQTANRFDTKRFSQTHPDLYDAFKKTTESRVFRIR